MAFFIKFRRALRNCSQLMRIGSGRRGSCRATERGSSAGASPSRPRFELIHSNREQLRALPWPVTCFILASVLVGCGGGGTNPNTVVFGRSYQYSNGAQTFVITFDPTGR